MFVESCLKLATKIMKNIWKTKVLLTVLQNIVGYFTFWISLSVRPNFGLRPNLIQKVKWRDTWVLYPGSLCKVTALTFAKDFVLGT